MKPENTNPTERKPTDTTPRADDSGDDTSTDAADLSAANTDHLRTEPDSEKVVPTDARAPRDDDLSKPPTDRFRNDSHIEPVSIGRLPGTPAE